MKFSIFHIVPRRWHRHHPEINLGQLTKRRHCLEFRLGTFVSFALCRVFRCLCCPSFCSLCLSPLPLAVESAPASISTPSLSMVVKVVLETLTMARAVDQASICMLIHVEMKKTQIDARGRGTTIRLVCDKLGMTTPPNLHKKKKQMQAAVPGRHSNLRLVTRQKLLRLPTFPPTEPVRWTRGTSRDTRRCDAGSIAEVSVSNAQHVLQLSMLFGHVLGSFRYLCPSDAHMYNAVAEALHTESTENHGSALRLEIPLGHSGRQHT